MSHRSCSRLVFHHACFTTSADRHEPITPPSSPPKMPDFPSSSVPSATHRVARRQVMTLPSSPRSRLIENAGQPRRCSNGYRAGNDASIFRIHTPRRPAPDMVSPRLQLCLRSASHDLPALASTYRTNVQCRLLTSRRPRSPTHARRILVANNKQRSVFWFRVRSPKRSRKKIARTAQLPRSVALTVTFRDAWNRIDSEKAQPFEKPPICAAGAALRLRVPWFEPREEMLMPNHRPERRRAEAQRFQPRSPEA